jgi:hypothetical protein
MKPSRNHRALPQSFFALALGAGLLSACVTGESNESADQATLRQSGNPNAATSAAQGNAPGAGTIKVDICHVPPGNTENIQYITVGSPAYDAHLEHGDKSCEELDIPNPNVDDSSVGEDTTTTLPPGWDS